MKILLIDDDKDDQLLFGEAVARISQTIVCEFADNGLEGIKCLKAGARLPQVVFLDLNMPLMDGWETLEVIRSTPVLDSLKVVIYSTSINVADTERLRSMQASTMLKPNSFEEIVERITHVLRETEQKASVLRHL